MKKFNERQMQELKDLGFEGTTQAEAREFYKNGKGMDDELRAHIDSFAQDPGNDAPPATPNGTVADIDQKIGDAAKKAATDAVSVERQRGAEILSLAETKKLGTDWANRHIKAGTSLDEAKRYADEIESATKNLLPEGSVRVGEDLNLSTIGPAMADAFCVRGGVKLVETDEAGEIVFENADQFGAQQKVKLRKPHQRAVEFRGLRMSEQIRRYLECLKPGCTRGLSTPQVCKMVFDQRAMSRLMGAAPGAHGTDDFDNILLDTINKSLRSAYTEWTPKWPIWAGLRFAPDFKTVSEIQLGEFSNPPAVREGAEYLYATIGDGKEQWTLGKYGHMFTHTWEAAVNDDMSALTRIPRQLMLSCLRIEDYLAFGILNDNAALADGTDLFHADHANYTSSGTALSVASLEVAFALMQTQTGLNSDAKLDIMPQILIVHPSKAWTARQLVGSPYDPAKSNNTPNPFEGSLEVVSSPYVSDTNGWYLAANPNIIDTVVVGFLEGMRAPQLEELNMGSIDGRTYKIKHVAAAKAIDHRGLYYNAGA